MRAIPPLARPSRPKATPTNEALALKNLVTFLQLHPGTAHQVDSLACHFGIQRRTLFDFVSICAVFGISRRTSPNTVEWFGLDRGKRAIDGLRAEVDAESQTVALQELFNYSLDPSLPRISIAVVKLFFFLSVKYLDLRKVGKLFAQGHTKYKTMVRKLYTVVVALEITGIVRKTSVVSEIQLNVPLLPPPSTSQMSLALVLNSRKELEDDLLFQRRRKEFEELAARPAQNPVVDPKPSTNIGPPHNPISI
jgi:hypothetical protein